MKPERIAEYRERHAAVWPEMLQALAETGWHNYPLFLRPDGLLIGYVESDDLAAAQAAMDNTDVNPRWQAEMGPFFEALDGPPDQGFDLLEEVFHLDHQLDLPPPAVETVQRGGPVDARILSVGVTTCCRDWVRPWIRSRSMVIASAPISTPRWSTEVREINGCAARSVLS